MNLHRAFLLSDKPVYECDIQYLLVSVPGDKERSRDLIIWNILQVVKFFLNLSAMMTDKFQPHVGSDFKLPETCCQEIG